MGRPPAKMIDVHFSESPRTTNVKKRNTGHATDDADAYAAREKLILEYLPRARQIARNLGKRLPTFICPDDLASAGVVGLIEAIDRFNPKRKTKLATFADFRIRGSILDSRSETDWAPRRKRRQMLKFDAARTRLEQELGRTPEEAEIARELNVTVDEYRQRNTKIRLVGLDYAPEGGRSVIAQPASPELTPEMRMQSKELRDLVAMLIERLPKLERTVVNLDLHEQLTGKEIARRAGISTGQVARAKRLAMFRLRECVADAGIEFQDYC